MVIMNFVRDKYSTKVLLCCSIGLNLGFLIGILVL